MTKTLAAAILFFRLAHVLHLAAFPRPAEPVEVKQIVSVGGVCTGFVAHPGAVFTAAHCVEDAVAAGEHSITVRFSEGQKQQFYIAGYGKTDHRDFAILFGDTLGIEPLSVSKSPPMVGDFCMTAGYGGGSPTQNATPCRVNKYEDGFIDLYGSVIPGDSGSPVFDAQSGEVFGIAVRSYFPVPEAEAVDVRWAERAYEELQNARRILPAHPAPKR